MVCLAIARCANNQERAWHLGLDVLDHVFEQRRGQTYRLDLRPPERAGHILVEHRQIVRRRAVTSQKANPCTGRQSPVLALALRQRVFHVVLPQRQATCRRIVPL